MRSQTGPLEKMLPTSEQRYRSIDISHGVANAGTLARWPRHVGQHPATGLEHRGHGMTFELPVAPDFGYPSNPSSYAGSPPPSLVTADVVGAFPEYGNLESNPSNSQNDVGDSRGLGLLSRKRRPRASFFEPPFSRMKSPPNGTSTATLLSKSSQPGTLVSHSGP